MSDFNIELRVRELLQRCSPSNDNSFNDVVKHQSGYIIHVEGSNNVIVDANIPFLTLLLISIFTLLYLVNL